MGEPLYRIRRRLLSAHERLDDGAWARVVVLLEAGDPAGEVGGRLRGRQELRWDVYLTDDPNLAATLLDKAIAGCGAE